MTTAAPNLSLGEVYWLAPEVVRAMLVKDIGYDLAADIWSLGCTIIEMLTGNPPWSNLEEIAAMFKVVHKNPPIPDSLSPEGKDFLMCCFRSNPSERPTAGMLIGHPFIQNSFVGTEFEHHQQDEQMELLLPPLLGKFPSALESPSSSARSRFDGSTMGSTVLTDSGKGLSSDVDEIKAPSKLLYHYTVANIHLHYQAAILIQKRFRDWKQHKRFVSVLKCVVKIQAHIRGHQVRKHWRTYDERKNYTLYKDLKAWLSVGKQQENSGFHHTCIRQAAPQLHGRDDIKQRITEEILLDRNSSCTVICIVAGSGVGKTSLLCVLHNSPQLLDAFDKRIWIQMSDKFDKSMLLRKIIECTIHDHCGITDLSFLEEMVEEELAGKKCLFFIDDAEVEDQHFWACTLEVLNVGAKGSVVVVSTRCTTVAAYIGGLHSYYLNPLSEENNLMLLQQYACIGQDIECNPGLMKIAKQFVARFGANPLNLKALGGLVSHSSYSDTVPLEKEEFEQNIVPCLRFCHDMLPIHLKQCVTFCSLFPKGYIFEKHHMVLLWLSQGFIIPVEGLELEDVGVEYFHELLCRSFFEYSPFHDDIDDKFVMHELIYDVVVSVSHEKYFKSEDQLAHIPEGIRHLSLISAQFQTVQLMSRTEDVRDLQTLLVVQPECQQYNTSFPTFNLVGLDDFFLKFRSLGTLDLSCTDMEELPSSIAALRNLQYLSVNNTRIRSLPSELCSLSNLQTLEAKGCCFLTELPEDTKRLVSLRHLNIGKELGYVCLPPGVGQLTKLKTLPVFHVGGDSSCCSISELGSLDGLRGCLLVAGLENVSSGGEANLKGKQHLQDLTLQWHDDGVDIDDDNDDQVGNVAEQVLESLQPHTNLQELAIRRYQGIGFPSWMQGSSSLPSLVSLTLDSCFNCARFPAIAQLPSLKFLSVRRMYDVQRLIGSDEYGVISKFPSLELINLWEMYGLEELFEASEGDCPRLRRICISRCPDLVRMPCVPSVVELVLHCCDHLPEISELVALTSLTIEGFHGVKSLSLPPKLQALRKLEIRHCDELSSVYGLSALTAVEILKIAGCPKLDWPRTDNITN